ncbi:unnamed protein product [Rotaria sp. Silwood2]|nr:unnamed protein product [Rotaria sp. Silwood2]
MEQQKDQLTAALERNKFEQRNIIRKVTELDQEVTNRERARQITEQKVNDTRNELRNIIRELDRLNKRETDLKNQSNTLRDKQDTLTREHDSIDDKKSNIDRNLSLARNKQRDNEKEVTSFSGKMASKENLVRTLRRAVVINKNPTADTNNDGGMIDFDDDNIENIRDEYALMTDEEKPTNALLKQLAQKLKINDDEKNLELLRLCIVEETIEGAKAEIRQRY